MTKRIFYSTFIVVTCVILLATTLFLGVWHSFNVSTLEDELRLEADVISSRVDEEGLDYLNDPDVPVQSRIICISGDGEAIFDTHAEQGGDTENYLHHTAVQQAVSFGRGFNVQQNLSSATVYYAISLADTNILLFSMVTESIPSLLLGLFPFIFITFLFGIAFSSLLARHTANHITNSLNQIDFAEPKTLVKYEELAPLSQHISSQKKHLQNRLSELSRRQQEFDTIISNIQEGLLVLDAQANIISYNQGALHLMDVPHFKLHQNVLEVNRSAPFRNCLESASQGNHCEENVQLGGKICQLFANPVFQSEEIVGIVLILFDVTEREKREVLRREFSANVSHELKTPLTSISGFAEIIKNGMVHEDDIQKFAGNIYDEAQRLMLLVQDIIKLSEMDENQTSSQMEEVDISLIIDKVITRLEPVAAKRNVTLCKDVVSITIPAISQILNEIVYNLCDNAIRYNVDGGSVTISVHEGADGVVLSVTDTGVGIAPGNRERVFERFYRVDESRNKNTAGSGLGLSIVKHGAQLHNATISIDSTLNKGTCISIKFPRKI